jgi:hypothetical protein
MRLLVGAAARRVSTCRRSGGTKRCGEEASDDVHEARRTVLGVHARDGCVGNIVAAAAQSSADDAHGVARRQPAAAEALGKGQHVVVAERRLELGESPEGEAQVVGAAVESGVDLAAVVVGHDNLAKLGGSVRGAITAP